MWIVALLAALAVVFLARPVLRPRSVPLDATHRDLEDDFETGKVAEPDYRTLREELRGRALALLQAERDAARIAGERTHARGPAGPSTPPPCPACAATPRAEDRFCGRCGVPLARPAPLEASA
jgi:hypothetical protein